MEQSTKTRGKKTVEVVMIDNSLEHEGKHNETAAWRQFRASSDLSSQNET